MARVIDEELDEELGPVESDTPDDVAVNSLLSEIAGDVNSGVTVYRSGPNQKNKFLFKCHPGDFSLEQLRDEYGGGDFRLYITKEGKLYKNVGVSIEPPRRAPEAPTPKNNPGDMLEMFREMQKQNMEQMQLMMLRMAEAMRANVPAPVDPIAMQNQLLSQLASMKSLFSRDETPRENPLDGILKGIELAKSLAPAPVGEANSTDVLLEAIRTLGGPIAAGLARMQGNEAPAPLESEPGVIEPPTPTHKKAAPDMNMVLKMQLGMLVKKAHAGADPALYADLILDNVPENQVRAFLLKPSALDELVKINAKVADVRPWFEQLAVEIRAALDGEGGEEEGGEEGELIQNGENVINVDNETDTPAA